MEIKTKKQLNKRLVFLSESFDKNIRPKIVEAVNEYLEHNEPMSKNEIIWNESVEKITDNLCLFGAWITDRLQGKYGFTSHPTYPKSLSRKIRKALGFNV